jgi:hypothetical protein
MLNSIVTDGERFQMPKWFWLGLACGVMGILGVRLIPLYQSKNPDAASASLSNIRQLGISLQIYLTDYDDVVPPAGDWAIVSYPYRKNNDMLNDPTLGHGLKYGYALFAPLSAKSVDDIANPAEIPLLFQSQTSSFNESGDLSKLPISPRGKGGTDIYSMLDSSAKVHPRAWGLKPVVIKHGTPPPYTGGSSVPAAGSAATSIP